MPIFRRTNCIITASGIVTLCKRLYSMPGENRLESALNRLVNEISLYCDARSKKHQIMLKVIYSCRNNVHLCICDIRNNVCVMSDAVKQSKMHMSS